MKFDIKPDLAVLRGRRPIPYNFLNACAGRPSTLTRYASNHMLAEQRPLPQIDPT